LLQLFSYSPSDGASEKGNAHITRAGSNGVSRLRQGRGTLACWRREQGDIPRLVARRMEGASTSAPGEKISWVRRAHFWWWEGDSPLGEKSSRSRWGRGGGTSFSRKSPPFPFRGGGSASFLSVRGTLDWTGMPGHAQTNPCEMTNDRRVRPRKMRCQRLGTGKAMEASVVGTHKTPFWEGKTTTTENPLGNGKKEAKSYISMLSPM